MVNVLKVDEPRRETQPWRGKPVLCVHRERGAPMSKHSSAFPKREMQWKPFFAMKCKENNTTQSLVELGEWEPLHSGGES